LTNDPNLQDRLTILGESLSTYYLAQAKHYLDRPEGTGANVGWTYLEEALKYKASNTPAVRDEMTRALAAHQLRSKLSIRVEFRDQTSRKDAVAFSEQLTDSLATGLETSNANIKVLRPTEPAAVPPNFSLIGDVLENAKSNSLNKMPKSSKYHTEEREVVNDEWNAANRDYESANLALQTFQQSLMGANARGKKGQIEEAQRQVADALKKVQATHIKLDSLPKTKAQVDELPYTYLEDTNDLKANVELQFRIQDSVGNAIVPEIPLPHVQHKVFITRENVKPEDTMGVRDEGQVPNEDQFLEEAEYQARDQLLKVSLEKVAILPGLILQAADHKASEGDNDGAAEQYMLYLNSTESQITPERRRAQKFLLENFNFMTLGDTLPKG
jgi:hypothetical protein